MQRKCDCFEKEAPQKKASTLKKRLLRKGNSCVNLKRSKIVKK